MYQNYIPFLRLNNFLSYAYTTFCFSIHPPMGIWIFNTFGLLWVMLVWNWYTNICLSPCFQLFLLNTQKRNCWIMCLINIILCIIFWGTSTPLHSGGTIVSPSLHNASVTSLTLAVFQFLTIAVGMVVKWYHCDFDLFL
jgi:uncharacterized YccA/Bax inhibitor family protein